MQYDEDENPGNTLTPDSQVSCVREQQSISSKIDPEFVIFLSIQSNVFYFNYRTVQWREFSRSDKPIRSGSSRTTP